MTRSVLAALGLSLSLLVLLPASLVRGDLDDPDTWFDLLDDETYRAAGLDKLTDEERAFLGGLVVQPGGPSFLEPEATAFLDRAGWRRVEIAGVFVGGGERRLLLVGDKGTALVEAWSSIEPIPPPGIHWGKETAGSWDILGPDGIPHHYTKP